MATRRSVAAVVANPAERQALIGAFIALKNERSEIDGRSTYDRYVSLHLAAMNRFTLVPQDASTRTRRNSAHRGPAFLPWHREFLFRLERDLQRVAGDPNLGLPYWDWTVDAPAVNQAANAIPPAPVPSLSLETLVGPNGEPQSFDIVISGPFDPNAWRTVNDFGRQSDFLQRTYGRNTRNSTAHLPTQQDVDNALASQVYDGAPWDESAPGFRNLLEGWQVSVGNPPGLHNLVHVWVGGSMGPGTSPNDPIFFLHHCNIDRIWAQWQARNNRTVADYLPQAGGPCGHNLADPMYPWDGIATADIVTPEDVWDYQTSRGFDYDPVPT